MLGDLERQPKARPAEDARRERIEELPPHVAVRPRRIAEPEVGRHKLDVGARARESGGELVIVGRRERRRICQDDAHRTVGYAVADARTHVERLSRQHLPPERRAFLREMIELVTRDAPDVVCLQELPVWSLPAPRALERHARGERRRAAPAAARSAGGSRRSTTVSSARRSRARRTRSSPARRSSSAASDGRQPREAAAASSTRSGSEDVSSSRTSTLAASEQLDARASTSRPTRARRPRRRLRTSLPPRPSQASREPLAGQHRPDPRARPQLRAAPPRGRERRTRRRPAALRITHR